MTRVVMTLAANRHIDIGKVEQAIALCLNEPIIFTPIGDDSVYSIPWAEAAKLFADDKFDELLEKIVRNFHKIQQPQRDVLVTSSINSSLITFSHKISQYIAVTLSAQTVLVSDANNQLQLDISYRLLSRWVKNSLIGIVVQGLAKSTQAPIIANVDADDTVALIKEKIGYSLGKHLVPHDTSRMSPAAFRYKLTHLARRAGKTIVLPEGDEPRTVMAANICANTGIAKCVLLADGDKVHQVAREHNITLSPNVEIVNPADIREDYIERFVQLRGHKGLTEKKAREQIKDNVVLGTLMLEKGVVDGLVSGAVHTTANTIRPPLQLIKTADPNIGVSSVFFMLLPNQVYIYGDCAVNPEPNAQQLADIAIQSADTAKAFGLQPLVAMLSYSTGSSGSGASVDKVVEAVNLVKQARPDIVIDGPLQYDAAIIPSVAKAKAPDSPVAGKATVFIFPDLNAGNIVYKAVQRSTDLVSIGPMLQGMRKPVNDLSRGALIDDIVYTIALTAIQAAQ